MNWSTHKKHNRGMAALAAAIPLLLVFVHICQTQCHAPKSKLHVSGRDYTIGLQMDGAVVAVGDNWRGQCNVNTLLCVTPLKHPAADSGRPHMCSAATLVPQAGVCISFPLYYLCQAACFIGHNAIPTTSERHYGRLAFPPFHQETRKRS